MPEVFGVPIGQDFNAANYERAFSRVAELGANTVTDRNSSVLWGSDDGPADGDHWEELYYTKLLGSAEKAASLHDRPPLTKYAVRGSVFAGYTKYHIAYKMLEEGVKDELHGISIQQVKSLGEVMEETHELTYIEPFNNGSSFVSGWQRKAMFSDTLGVIGDDAYVSSNIFYDLGGPSYEAIEVIDTYGANYVTQENRPSSRKVVMIATGFNTAREWAYYYDTAVNVEQGGRMPAPTNSGKPNIVALNRMANPRDTWVFYEGWQDMFRTKTKYRGAQRSWDEPSPKAVIHEIASRFLFFFRESRLVALIPGPSGA